MPGGKLIVALDGPAGAGKSTVSRRVAQALGFAYVDTGAIYRCIALKATLQGVAVGDDAALRGLVENVQVAFEFSGDVNRVKLDGRDVTDAIRTPENSRAASVVSARPVVRAGLLGLQRRLALDAPQPGAVLEGRDIGTVVFPDAALKVYLTASPEVRAERRSKEVTDLDYATVAADIARRDAADQGRDDSPLAQAEGALVVDTSDRDIDEIVASLVSHLP